jgi:TetR/AcrR family transcriptional regulator
VPSEETAPPHRRWGSASALLDDDEARRRLLAAAGRCIVRQGRARVSMTDVADEAAVTRSTLYRYFPTRDDLVTGLIVSRIDAAIEVVVASLRHPRDAARSLEDIILRSLARADSSPMNEALFSSESHAFVSALELGSERVVDAYLSRLGPLLTTWQSDGQLHGDLDIRETVRWMVAVSLMLLGPPWRARSSVEKRVAVERYFVRAVVRS